LQDSGTSVEVTLNSAPASLANVCGIFQRCQVVEEPLVNRCVLRSDYRIAAAASASGAF